MIGHIKTPPAPLNKGVVFVGLHSTDAGSSNRILGREIIKTILYLAQQVSRSKQNHPPHASCFITFPICNWSPLILHAVSVLVFISLSVCERSESKITKLSKAFVI